jgi:phosphatidylglycerophosphate synthase
VTEGSRVQGSASPNAAFKPPTRIMTSLLSDRERVLLNALCRRTPASIAPDMLTAIGVAGAFLAALGYVASAWSPEFLFVASLGIAVNWLGDSLDGSLARHRGIERPRYGYFVDHAVDALSGLIFAVGLGLSPYVSMAAALLFACGYSLLTIYVLLTAGVSGAFPLAKAFIGPTELRLISIAFNLALFVFGPQIVQIAGFDVSLWSALVVFEALAFIAVFIIEVIAMARRLKRLDAGG